MVEWLSKSTLCSALEPELDSSFWFNVLSCVFICWVPTTCSSPPWVCGRHTAYALTLSQLTEALQNVGERARENNFKGAASSAYLSLLEARCPEWVWDGRIGEVSSPQQPQISSDSHVASISPHWGWPLFLKTCMFHTTGPLHTNQPLQRAFNLSTTICSNARTPSLLDLLGDIK